jgi:hypothetical protein
VKSALAVEDEVHLPPVACAPVVDVVAEACGVVGGAQLVENQRLEGGAVDLRRRQRVGGQSLGVDVVRGLGGRPRVQVVLPSRQGGLIHSPRV